MTRYQCLFMLFGALSLGRATQAIKSPAKAIASNPTLESASVSRELATSPQKPLITIVGVCDDAGRAATSTDCKTLITRDEFERVVNALQPGMTMRARHEFALQYAEDLVMAGRAEQMGLDKGPDFEEQIKIARIQVLSQDLKKAVREKASNISESEIESYYRDNITRFEKAEVDRVYVPGRAQSQADTDTGTNDSREHLQNSEGTIKDEAEKLRIRALAGEDFAALQADAYRSAGIQSGAPPTNMRIRSVSLPPTHLAIMNMKPGEISPVLEDANGFYIYRLRALETIPLDQVRNEIKDTLRSEAIQKEIGAVLGSATSTVDETYFVQ